MVYLGCRDNCMANKVTISIKQIMAMADFAGLVIDEDKSFDKEDKESFLETEFTIEENIKISRDGKNYYEGMAVCCTEYPEEGFLPLEDKKLQG